MDSTEKTAKKEKIMGMESKYIWMNGELVEFECVKGPKGLQAQNVSRG